MSLKQGQAPPSKFNDAQITVGNERKHYRDQINRPKNVRTPPSQPTTSKADPGKKHSGVGCGRPADGDGEGDEGAKGDEERSPRASSKQERPKVGPSALAGRGRGKPTARPWTRRLGSTTTTPPLDETTSPLSQELEGRPEGRIKARAGRKRRLGNERQETPQREALRATKVARTQSRAHNRLKSSVVHMWGEVNNYNKDDSFNIMNLSKRVLSPARPTAC